MSFDVLRSIVYCILTLTYLYYLAKLGRENKQLRDRVDILQQQLIDALNKDIKNQDNFSTEPVE